MVPTDTGRHFLGHGSARPHRAVSQLQSSSKNSQGPADSLRTGPTGGAGARACSHAAGGAVAPPPAASGRNPHRQHAAELKSSGIRLRTIFIVGHTDPMGTNEFTQRLSLTRANSVRDYLAGQGVPAIIITTEGRRFSALKATEADCRAQGKARKRTPLIVCFEPNRRGTSAPRASSRANTSIAACLACGGSLENRLGSE
ncbi:OmpA family protein [Variovorax saccharolyticus]|uniref:OmpA family protein n=1 Tax=Variovorax saccharolyticus TaxID=3053516 RepID=UPI003369C76F